MIAYLAFDSRSIKTLLSEDNKDYFDDKFPVFYKNKEGKSSIDVALGNNQIRSVNLMIDYIVKYQNSYVYSHLFEHNLVELLNKNVTMTGIFNSRVFNHPFDYDEWPTTNSNTDKMLEPYNHSIFKLRYEYPMIFTKIWRTDFKNQSLELEGKFNMNEQKVFKIKYMLNILPSVSEVDA
jgi:hypothetical protein